MSDPDYAQLVIELSHGRSAKKVLAKLNDLQTQRVWKLLTEALGESEDTSGVGLSRGEMLTKIQLAIDEIEAAWYCQAKDWRRL